MILYVANKYEGNWLTREVNYFFEQNELFAFLNSQKKIDNQHYRGSAVDPLENKMYRNPINWHPGEMGKDDSIDYIEEYRQFKSNLKSKYQPISVSLFLKNYPRLLLQEEVLKLLQLK